MKEKIQRLRHILYRFKGKLLYTSAFGKALRRMMWKEAGTADGLRIIFQQEQDAFAGHTMNHIADAAAIKRFEWEVATWSKQSDYIYQVEGNITIDPRYSLAYLPGRKFLVPTRGAAHKHLVPDFLKANFTAGRKYTTYDALIHFDGFISRNLYHFLDDAVSPLLMLLKSGLVDKATPVLIHEQIYNIPYVQYVLNLPVFKTLNWVVQKKGEWIKTGKLYKAVASSVHWKGTYELLGQNVVKNPHRKIFLNRKAVFQRRLLNNDEIEAIIHEYGFETVYAEDITYEQQVALFSQTSHLVAIHGAGVTNVLYSDLSRVHVLEIFSEGLLHPHFYWFLELLKVHYYDAIVGSAFDINWNFSINAKQFKKQLAAMMNNL